MISNQTKRSQLNNLIRQCYDDYCFYNQMDLISRKKYVSDKVAAVREDELVIPYLPVYLTTCCTLNCEKCNNLMPYFCEAGIASDFDWEKTRQSLIRILSNVKEIVFCELVGGEPFLYKDFDKVLDFLSKEKKIQQIIIVTNGTVIPSDDVIEKMSNINALVRVSDYGLFSQMSKFVAKLDKAGVNIRIQQDMKWNDPGDILPRRKTEEELNRQYNRCEFSLKCKYLCEDKLFTCARAASLYRLGISDCEGDVLSISENIKKEEIEAFYLHSSGKICDYCDLWSDDKGHEIPAAIQTGNKSMYHSRYTVISNYELKHFKEMTKKYEKLLKEGKINE